MQQLAQVERPRILADRRYALRDLGLVQAALGSQRALDVAAKDLARACQLARTGRLVLAEELARLGKRQLLRIVTGESEPVARRQVRDRAREGIAHHGEISMLLSIAGAGFRLRVTGVIFWQRFQAASGSQAIDVALSQDRSQPGR